MAAILTFLLSPLGRILAGAGGVFLIVFAFGAQQRAIERNKIEAKSNAAVSLADKAGASSRNPGARGVRDPYTID